jgi:hypothetical protein
MLAIPAALAFLRNSLRFTLIHVSLDLEIGQKKGVGPSTGVDRRTPLFDLIQDAPLRPARYIARVMPAAFY